MVEVFCLYWFELKPQSLFLPLVQKEKFPQSLTSGPEQCPTKQTFSPEQVTNLVNQSLAVVCGCVVVCFSSAFVCVYAHSEKKNIHAFEEYDPAAAIPL